MQSNDLEACGEKCCYFLFHSEVKFLTRFLRPFGLIFILPYFDAICKGFYAVKCFNLHLFCMISNVCKWKNAYLKYLNALRI